MEYNIESDEGILVQGKGNCSKLKKKKLKTKNKKLVKIAIFDGQSLSAINRQSQSSASLKLRKYVFTKTWKVAVTSISISESK